MFQKITASVTCAVCENDSEDVSVCDYHYDKPILDRPWGTYYDVRNKVVFYVCEYCTYSPPNDLDLRRLSTRVVHDRVIVQDGIAQVRRSRRTHYVKQRELTRALGVTNSLALDKHPIPPHIRWYHPDNKGGGIVIVEEPPQIRNILVNMDVEKRISKDQEYVIATPYVISIIKLQQQGHPFLYVGYRDKPVTSLSDIIASPRLLNVDRYFPHMACIPDAYRRLYPYGNPNESLVDQANIVVTHFWGSQFNRSLQTNSYTMYDKNISVVSHNSMEELTQERGVDWTLKDKPDGYWTETGTIADVLTYIANQMGERPVDICTEHLAKAICETVGKQS